MAKKRKKPNRLGYNDRSRVTAYMKEHAVELMNERPPDAELAKRLARALDLKVTGGNVRSLRFELQEERFVLPDNRLFGYSAKRGRTKAKAKTAPTPVSQPAEPRPSEIGLVEMRVSAQGEAIASIQKALQAEKDALARLRDEVATRFRDMVHSLDRMGDAVRRSKDVNSSWVTALRTGLYELHERLESQDDRLEALTRWIAARLPDETRGNGHVRLKLFPKNLPEAAQATRHTPV